MIRIGDKVKVVDEIDIFTVREVAVNYVILVDKHGFESKYPLNKIISQSINDYITYETQNISLEKEESKTILKKANKKDKEQIRIVDLHIGNLVDFVSNITPHQMLEKQLLVATQQIELAKKDKVEKLILIHGKGKGVLKTKLYEILKEIPRIEYLEADISRYKFGAVEIRFK